MRFSLVVALVPFASGCALLGPVVQTTPAITVREPDVKAFYRTHKNRFDSVLIAGAYTIAQYVEPAKIENGVVAPRRHWWGNWVVCGILVGASSSETIELVLYRRGYEIESLPGRSPLHSILGRRPEVVWKPITCLRDAEEALRSLELESPFSATMSSEMRAFLADEHRWLAESDWAGPDDRKRLRERSQAFGTGE